MKFSIQARLRSDGIALASAIRPGVKGRSIVHLSTAEAVASNTCTDKRVGTIATGVSAMIHEPVETAAALGRPALVSRFAADAVVKIEATAGTVCVVSGISSAAGQLNLPYSTSCESYCDEHLAARLGAC